MKILFLTNHLKGDDGWSRYSLDLIEEVLKYNYEVLCLTSEESGQVGINEQVVLESPLRFLANPLYSWLTAQRIKRIIRKFSPDLIHFLVEPYATILPFLDLKDIRTFLTIHGTYSTIPLLFDLSFKKIISDFLSRKYYQRVDKIIAVSNYTKRHCLGYFSKKIDSLKNKIIVINNGVNLNRHKIILPHKSNETVKRILSVGVVKERKGFIYAIDACKYYYDHYSKNFIYEIVGSYSQQDKYYQQIVQRIKKYNLDNKVFFRGKVSEKELEQYYARADLFMMLSIPVNHRFEGFGLVFLEANTKGVPCIGSINSGCQEAILKGVSGYVVNPYKPNEVATKIHLVLNQKTIKRKDCIFWAKQNSISEKIKELILLYEKA